MTGPGQQVDDHERLQHHDDSSSAEGALHALVSVGDRVQVEPLANIWPTPPLIERFVGGLCGRALRL